MVDSDQCPKCGCPTECAEGVFAEYRDALIDLLDSLERGDGYQQRERMERAGKLLGFARYLPVNDGGPHGLDPAFDDAVRRLDYINDLAPGSAIPFEARRAMQQAIWGRCIAPADNEWTTWTDAIVLAETAADALVRAGYEVRLIEGQEAP